MHNTTNKYLTRLAIQLNLNIDELYWFHFNCLESGAMDLTLQTRWEALTNMRTDKLMLDYDEDELELTSDLNFQDILSKFNTLPYPKD